MCLERQRAAGPIAEINERYLHAAATLGRRTAEMHAALADDRADNAFASEPYTPTYQRSLFQSMRNTTRHAIQILPSRCHS